MNLKKYQNISQQDYEAVAGTDWPSYNQFQQHESVAPFVYAEIDAMLTGPREFNNSTFCILPFYGMEIPSRTACCLLSTNNSLEDIRSDMLQNRRPAACNKCWTLEDAGIKSDRMVKNETLDFYSDRDIISFFEECQQGQYSTVHYKIDTSNTCNSTCVTCNSSASSLWGQLESRHASTPHKSWSLNYDQVAPDIDFARAKSIGFRGGEPLLSATNFEILQKLIEYNNTNCFINFTTNGSVVLNQKQKDILAQFSNVNMAFSIDGIDSVFEYLRYPLKWEQILKNIDYCKSVGIIVSTSFTISNLNILYFDKTIKWFDQNQIRYFINPVYNPVYFKPSSLPKSVKDKILTLSGPTVANFLSVHTELDEINYAKFCREIDKQDRWKGIKMKDYLPELAELLD